MTYEPENEAEAVFLAAYDPSKFPLTVVTVDTIVHTTGAVALIKRGNYPFKGYWALPGGFIDQNETTLTAAARELREEAGLDVEEERLSFVGVADDPERDPRARAISFVYAAELPTEVDLYAGDDAVECRWFTWNEVPRAMAFDHFKILYLYIAELAGGLR